MCSAVIPITWVPLWRIFYKLLLRNRINPFTSLDLHSCWYFGQCISQFSYFLCTILLHDLFWKNYYLLTFWYSKLKYAIKMKSIIMMILEHVAQRSCGCPIPGGVQGQAGWGFGQPGLVGGVPAQGRGVGTRWSFRSCPT